MAVNELEVDSVQFWVGDRHLLSDVYLKCRTGEIIGLLGRNGCGKSTLLKIIFGTVATENKNIRINGKPYARPFTQHLVSYLPQESCLPPDLPIRQLIPLFVPGAAQQEQVRQNLHIRQKLNQTPAQLSVGQRRYLEILLLLHLEAPFLLLDEPFSGIEPLLQEQIQELLQAHRSTKGLLITDHDYRQILSISDQLLLLRNGACRPVKQFQELEEWGYLPEGTLL